MGLSGVNKYQYPSLSVSLERVNNSQALSGPCRANKLSMSGGSYKASLKRPCFQDLVDTI